MPECSKENEFVRENVKTEITEQVIRAKLSKRRHLVLQNVIDASYLKSLQKLLEDLFEAQVLVYNGGSACSYKAEQQHHSPHISRRTG